MAIQLDAVIVGHGGDVVHDDLVGLGLLVGDGGSVVILLHEGKVVAEDGRGGVVLLQIAQQALVE